MKRSGPPKRKRGLAPPKAQLKRAALQPVNRKRREKLRAEQFGDPRFQDWVRAMACLVCGSRPVELAHARSRGAGGKASDIVPLCAGPRGCHALQHQMGIKTFEHIYDVDLRAEAASLAVAWQDMQADAAA